MYIYLTVRHITFKDDDGKILNEIKMKKGEVLNAPEEPTKHNCEFMGWKKDRETYDFSKKIEDDMVLVAE